MITKHFNNKFPWIIYPILAILLYSTTAYSANIKIAVASNFYGTLEKICQHYHQQNNNHKCEIITSSSAVLANQIYNGLNIDIFFSADKQKPLYLYNNMNIKFPNLKPLFPVLYAQGKLILYSTKDISKLTTAQIKRILSTEQFVIPDPDKAPYGKVAQKYLKAHLNIDINQSAISNHVIRQQDATSAFATIHQKYLDYGFVAYSDIINKKIAEPKYIILNSKDTNIQQYAIILRNKSLAREFIEFLKTKNIRQIILDSGYK